VVDVPTTRVAGVAQESDELEQLLTLEKRIALELFDELGVTLTVAERNAIEQRPTRSLAAFLSYSRGLTAEDERRYDDASRFYRDAMRLDPGFGAALQKDRDVRGLLTGERLSARWIESGFARNGEGVGRGRGSAASDAAHAAADDLNPSSAGAATAPGRSGEHGPPQKDAASAATRTDKPGKNSRGAMMSVRRGKT